MNLYLALAVDESQDVVARNRMTAVFELILVDVLVADVDGLLAVEVLSHHKELLALVLGFLLVVLTASEERHQLAPSALVSLVLALQLVNVFLAQQDGLLSQCLEEVFAVAHLVELSQLVGSVQRVLYAVLLQELVEHLLALLLLFSVVTAQDGLYLCFGLRRAHKVNP